MEKTKGQEEFDEEEPVLDFPSHFFDPITRADDVMTKRVQELVEKAAALSRSQSDVKETGSSEDSQIVGPPSHYREGIPSVLMETPLAKSTPFDPSQQRRGVRFPDLKRVEEKEENDQSVHIQFEEPPLDTLALLMSMLNQPHPITQYIVPASTKELESQTQEDSDKGDSTPLGRPLSLQNNVILSRQCLNYKRDNLVHFLAKDCKFNTPVSRLLSEIGAIEASTLKAKRPKFGQILTHGQTQTCSPFL